MLVIASFTPGVVALGDADPESSLYAVMTEVMEEAEVSVYSSEKNSDVEVTTIATETDAEEGLEVVENFVLTERDETSDESLWIKAEVADNAELQDREMMSLYSVEDSKLDEVIVEDIADDDELCEIEEDVNAFALVKDTGLRRKALEVTPSDGDSSSKVKLNGMMPKEAKAEVVDVTEKMDNAVTATNGDATSDAVADGERIAAFDISIKDGEEEYQPDSKNPIKVEIKDSRIKNSNSLHIWHIKDNGEREEVKNFTLSNGKVCFSADGFSVYEIVDVIGKNDAEEEYVLSIDGFTDPEKANKGFVLFYGADNSRYYFKNSINGNNCFYETRDIKEASVWYFELADNSSDTFYIYTIIGGNKQYISQKDVNSNNIKLTNDKNTAFEISKKNDNMNGYFYYKHSGEKRWLQHSGSGSGIRFYTDNNNATNSQIKAIFKSSLDAQGDTIDLDGKTYGLMNYTGGTHGFALVAEDNKVHSLVELVTHQTSDNGSNTIYVDEGSEVTRWTFHKTASGKFILSGSTENGTKYLAASGNDLSLSDSVEGAASFDIVADDDGKIQLSYDNKYVTFTQTGVDGELDFILSSSSSSNSWFNFIDFATFTDEDLLVYSAKTISVSEAINGQKVIVYTRIWDDSKKQYDVYAIDYNGTLYKCYSSGGKILWIGNGTGSLEWEFTEYLDEITKQPNNYYELYNTYSEKYIAPQFSTGQIISDDKKGINMSGRKVGEFYSDIISWDNGYYAYVGMKAVDIEGTEGKKKLVPCSQSACLPFYFATLEELNQNDSIHIIPTVNNYEHGITLKMQDFSSRDSMSNFLGSNEGGAVLNTQPNLLSTKLGTDGYPTITTGTHKGESLAGLYTNPKDVNGLFIDSVYESSGYFEFDSCQNFATLCNDDGTIKSPKIYTDSKGNEVSAIDFTVYKELGTTDNTDSATRKHGQFLPYDNIVGKGISKHQNTYSSLTNLEGTFGELPDDDPRKYERMFNVGNQPNYYNGMELEANFVQTVSGLDAWGHDIIFEFTGDDDFWLYVDGELIIDLGGIHSALQGRVNFKTGEVFVNGVTKTLKQIFIENYTSRYKTEHAGAEPSADEIKTYLLNYFQPDENKEYGCEDIFADYSTHNMRIFYMERGAGASNLHMKFNIASVTPGNVVVSKTLSGNGVDSLDTDFLEYPFQICYKEDYGNGNISDWIYLENKSTSHIGVSYQNSNQPVTFMKSYRPPGFTEEQAYQNVYFINPTRKAEISFPDDAISYKIVECAVDSTVYETVTINGENVSADRVKDVNGFFSYESELSTAEQRPTIAFDNQVKDNVIKDLKITKVLDDENGNEIPLDEIPEDAIFSFRLSISNVDVDADDIPRANMVRYYLLSPNEKLCRYDSSQGKFTETSYDYTKDNIDAIKNGSVTGIEYDNIAFVTSPFGAIANIPAGYTIVVPGLPAGTIFKVTEDVKPGYGLDHYERVMGDKKEADGTIHQIDSYHQYDGNPLNIGKIYAEANPQMKVHNKKGYGFTVNKKWSDVDLTTGHDPIFVAVYVDGVLLDNSLKKITSPSTSAYYFWPSLENNTDGSERTSLDGYVVKEVKVTSGTPVVSEDGTVTNQSDLTIEALDAGGRINLTATRTATATPTGEQNDKAYDYVVSYEQGTDDGSTRTDTITNTRDGGIKIRLFKWDSEIPLNGGTFTLADNSGKVVGEYTSDSTGKVTILYEFEHNKFYTLTQTLAPEGYVGLQKKLKFKVNADETVSLYYEDGTAWGSSEDPDDQDDIKWANSKPGENGITAFIDVYNKQFNFKIMKMDGDDADQKLGAAHFALHKQSNTTISGYVKVKEPMTGFEDMVTINGVVDICGGSSGRVIKPGPKGSVYFLTETQAPLNYKKLEDDIIFKVSPLGVPSLISDSYNGKLVETEDSYVYTLDVPNTREDPSLVQLTVDKYVAGNMGNKTKEFEFTFKLDESKYTSEQLDTLEFDWTLNGEVQTTKIKHNTSFMMGHGDEMIVILPIGTNVVISEDSDGYIPSFVLDSVDQGEISSLPIEVNTDAKLEVTNTYEALVPTGVWISLGGLLVLLGAILAGLGWFIRRSRRLHGAMNE